VYPAGQRKQETQVQLIPGDMDDVKRELVDLPEDLEVKADLGVPESIAKVKTVYAPNKTSRHNQGHYRFHAQSDRLQPDPHSQIADGLADSAHNQPVAPRVRRQKDRKSATLHVLQRTASAEAELTASRRRACGQELAADWD
jgi:hypothetical protein